VTRRRLSTRTSNRYGRKPEIQDWIFTWKEGFEQSLLREGAKLIDADKPLAEVADEALSVAANTTV